MGNLLPAGTCQITNGPSKYDLQAALFDSKQVQFSVDTRTEKTTIEIGKKFNVILNLIGREDGSGESWIGKIILISTVDPSESEERIFYYDTRRRRGIVMEKTKTWSMQ